MGLGADQAAVASDPSVSITRGGSVASLSPQMAVAAGTPKVPASTPRRANSAFCPAASRPELQSGVFLSVRCRSDRSCGPVVSTLIGSESRASSAPGGSGLIRAAASTMASGRPSSARQIPAMACALRAVSSKPGAAARARHEHADRGVALQVRGIPDGKGRRNRRRRHTVRTRR